MTVQKRVSQGCCGMVELFNFNYTATSISHFHRNMNTQGWDSVRSKQTPTTREEIEKLLLGNSIYFATTGLDQEYLTPILTAIGFKPTVFRNKGHHQTFIIHWLLDRGLPVAPGEVEALLAKA
jgi:hypothetical protein